MIRAMPTMRRMTSRPRAHFRVGRPSALALLPVSTAFPVFSGAVEAGGLWAVAGGSVVTFQDYGRVADQVAFIDTSRLWNEVISRTRTGGNGGQGRLPPRWSRGVARLGSTSRTSESVHQVGDIEVSGDRDRRRCQT